MLYTLAQWFDFNLFSYITVRAGLGFISALILTLLLYPLYIRWAIAKNAKQPINKYVPGHDSKAHTPTMGGAVFVSSIALSVLMIADLSNPYIWLGLASMIGFGLIGLKDDIGKVLAADNLQGLTPRGKLILQIALSLLMSTLLYFQGFSTEFYIPFVKTPLADLDYFAIALWTLLFVATSNAVNLTDGLDGLATVPSIIAYATLGLIVYMTGHAIISDYLLMPNIKGVGEATIIAAAFAGGLMGFLWFNCHPAQLFMGDTGSLAIGGTLAYLGILGKSEVLMLLIGFIFVIEALSVIIQVVSFKIRGERVFLMAPIHHHFEMKDWHENKIIVRFWMIAFIANVLALATLKIR
jgi:phospho-N-acetylmuramoyl-pentapeptide-transferase